MKAEINILICDDNEFVRETLGLFIQDLGKVHCDFAKDGKEALDKITEPHYDLIIMDLQMPFFSGAELINMIRQKQKSNVPILVLSGQAMDEQQKQKLLNLGAADIILKPFQPKEVNMAIRKNLNLNEPLRIHI